MVNLVYMAQVVRKCSIEGCNNKHHGKSFCEMHYTRLRKYGDPTVTARVVGEDRTTNPLYGTYKQMVQRCQNPNHKYYKYYGGRGITVCKRWQPPHGFTNFLADMGERPEGMTIDRIRNDRGYTPDNCIWATRSEQQINTRVSSANTTGTKGVHLHKVTGRYTAYIERNGKRKHLGYFKTKDDAIKARMKAELN